MALKDEKYHNLIDVAKSLHKIGRETGEDLITPIINDPNATFESKRGALIALGIVNHPRALEILSNVVKDTDSRSLRYAAVQGLIELKDIRAFQELTKYDWSSDDEIREKISWAFADGDESLLPYLKGLCPFL